MNLRLYMGKRVIIIKTTIDNCWACPNWTYECYGMSDKSRVYCKLIGCDLNNMNVIPENCPLEVYNEGI